MSKKKSISDYPEVHNELEGLNIEINKFGELSSTMNIEKVNQFLNENVEDKKLKDQKNDFEQISSKED